jgi:hypothetical protein
MASCNRLFGAVAAAGMIALFFCERPAEAIASPLALLAMVGLWELYLIREAGENLDDRSEHSVERRLQGLGIS